MSRLAKFADAIQTAMQTRRPVLAFGAWRSIGSLPAVASTLVVSAVHRLHAIPLNPIVTYVPFSRTDDLALDRRVRAARVVASRRRARVHRYQTGTQMPGDLEFCDWDVPAQIAAREAPSCRFALKSYIALDRITADGSIARGARPVLGHRTKRGGSRLPELAVLATRSATDTAIAALTKGDLGLISLSGARGAKTVALVASALARVPQDWPVVIVAECAAELVRFFGEAERQRIQAAVALAAAPTNPELRVCLVGQTRVQYEVQFRYAVPTEDLSPEEKDVADVAWAAWRERWATVDADVRQSPVRERFAKAYSELRRQHPAAADRFNLFSRLLTTSEGDASASAKERLEIVVRESVSASDMAQRVLVVVGGSHDDAVLRRTFHGLRTGGSLSVGISRHLARVGIPADAVVLCGYYGAATLDGVLRAGARSVTWILDPIEAEQAAWALHQQAATLHSLGLGSMADLLGRFDEALRRSAAGTRSAGVGDHPGLFDRISAGGAGGHEEVTDDGELVSETDAEADYVVVLLDGSRLHVKAGQRFDVLRSQSPHPQTVRAEELQEGDEILIVRGSHQETLSELLLEDLDRTALRADATIRDTWAAVAQSAMEASGLSIEAVVRRLRSQGAEASAQRVRSWLKADQEETTPRDWRHFLAFARAIGIGLAESDLTYYYDRIRRWRIEHRKRGRAVIRAVRLAYFGGLSPSDLARIETEWGLGVRDLIEGCRVEEVESVHRLTRA